MLYFRRFSRASVVWRGARPFRPGCAHRSPVRMSPRSPGRSPRPSAARGVWTAAVAGARTLGGFPVPVRGLRALAVRCGDVGTVERAVALWGGR